MNLQDDFLERKKATTLGVIFAVLTIIGTVICFLDYHNYGKSQHFFVQLIATAIITTTSIDFWLRRNLYQSGIFFGLFTVVFLSARYIGYGAYLAPSVIWFTAFPPSLGWITEKRIGLWALVVSTICMVSCWVYFFYYLNLVPTGPDIVYMISSITISSYLTYIVTETQSLYDHHIQEKLEYERQELHQSQLASLGELAGNIAHEMNNPLQVIKGNASLLTRKLEDLIEEEKATSETSENKLERTLKIQKYAQNIDRTVDRTKKIIDSLLKLARQQDSEITLEQTSLSEVWNQAYPLIENNIRQHSANISFFNMEKKFKAKPEFLAQVLINLINNSLFEIKDQDNPWIRVELRDHYIDVVDSGPGLNEDAQENILKPFFTTKGNKGTGLGLPLCAALMKQMGGDFIIPPQQKHTTFRLVLPEES